MREASPDPYAPALRLAKVFGTSVQFWMGLQDEYELRETLPSINSGQARAVTPACGLGSVLSYMPKSRDPFIKRGLIQFIQHSSYPT